MSPRTILVLLLGVLGAACSAGHPDTSDDPPCSCTVGAERCTDDQIQVCEATTPACPTWGPPSTCPGGGCEGDRCPGSCSDVCSGGTTRCAGETDQEVCRIGPSGCLEWVAQACPTAEFCGA